MKRKGGTQPGWCESHVEGIRPDETFLPRFAFWARGPSDWEAFGWLGRFSGSEAAERPLAGDAALVQPPSSAHQVTHATTIPNNLPERGPVDMAEGRNSGRRSVMP